MMPSTRTLGQPAGLNLDFRLLAIAAGLVLLCLLPAIAAWADQPFLLRLFTRVVIFAIIASGLDLILGFGGMVSMGQAAFVGLGAYVVGILGWHAGNGTPLVLAWSGTDNAWVAWPLALAVTAAAAAAIGWVSLRTSGMYFIMITLAFAQMLYYSAVALQRYGGEDGLSLPGPQRLAVPGLALDLSDRTTFYYLCLALLVVVVGGLERLVNSRFGLVLQGCRQNDRRMAALGFSTFRYRLAAFVLSAVIAALGGILLANANGFVSPADMAWTRSGEILIMVILGGLGTVFGPVLGAAVFILLEFLLEEWTSHWPAVLGLIMLAVLMFARGGLFSLLPRREMR